MYSQVPVNQLGRDFQRFVQRTSPEEEIQDYRMKTVTFSVACILIWLVMNKEFLIVQLANEWRSCQIPFCFRVVERFLKRSIANLAHLTWRLQKTAIEIQKEVFDMLCLGGFELRKWSASHIGLLKDLPLSIANSELTLTLIEGTLIISLRL